MAAREHHRKASTLAPIDPATGLVVRAVVPVAEFSCWATFMKDGQREQLPVLAWADCVTPEGQWMGLLPIVPFDRATGTVADVRNGFTGITFPGTAYR